MAHLVDMTNRLQELEKELTSGNLTANTAGCSIECLPILIRQRAYQIFELRGGQPGRDLDDWLQAESEIKHHLGL